MGFNSGFKVLNLETELSWEIRLFICGIVAADGVLGCDPV